MSHEDATVRSERASPPIPVLQAETYGRSLSRAYWLVVYAVGLGLLARGSQIPLQTALAAGLICAAALAPAYFWCTGRSAGLPVFPVFALTFTWTYALPLLNEHPGAMRYTPDDHFVAGVAVSGFLLLTTFMWLLLSWSRPTSRRLLLVLRPSRAVPWLIAAVGVDAVFWIARQAGWMSFGGGTLAIVAAVTVGLSTIATFVLFYLRGTGALRAGEFVAACALLLLDALASMTGLLLINVLSKIVVGVLGATLGGRRLPVIPVALLLAAIIPLHYGKHRMRDAYWARGTVHEAVLVQPWEYPQFFAEWYGYAAANIGHESTERSDTESFATRASLIHLFLLARDHQEHGTPPLAGATYAIIPALLIPRVLMPDKLGAHEGTHLLNIHYGLQRRVDTYTSTIGWGLFNEAYGNFGYAGVVGLALVLGTLLGMYARWTADVPELSARFLGAVLVLAIAFQTEFSAGVLVSTLFQSNVALAALILALGGRRVAVSGTASTRRVVATYPVADSVSDSPAHA